MKRIVILLILLCFCVSGCTRVEPAHDPPAGDELYKPAKNSVTLDFEANYTTGYDWFAKIVSGSSVRLTDRGYVSDPNPQMMDGVGGRHYFLLEALREGETVIRFHYSRDREDDEAFPLYYLAVADQDMTVHVYDITDTMRGGSGSE